MRDLYDRMMDLLADFRESGFCTERWVDLKQEPHDDKCPEATPEQGED